VIPSGFTAGFFHERLPGNPVFGERQAMNAIRIRLPARFAAHDRPSYEDGAGFDESVPPCGHTVAFEGAERTENTCPEETFFGSSP
jgi:hypothetical protein